MLQFILGQGQWELVFGKKKKERKTTQLNERVFVRELL